MNPAALRILDANANRAREALRVLEDYARFALDSDALSTELKDLRHRLAGATAPFVQEAILHRDTPGDVGTDNKTATEAQRQGVEHVVVAAGKRLGEALRCLGEFAKIDHPQAAAALERLRYDVYAVEQRIARTLCPAERFAAVRLCVLITESACRGPWMRVAEQAIAGGADCLQLREKELDGREVLCRAKDFVALCRQHETISIINDRPDIAILSGADGVHVGQMDLPVPEVRRLMGPQRIVGVSTHRIEQARQAVLDGATYIGVGPIFASATKPRDFVAGPQYARQVAAEVRIPALAIAGITEANLDEVLATGIQAIAVTAAIGGCEDVRGAAERLKRRLAMVG